MQNVLERSSQSKNEMRPSRIWVGTAAISRWLPTTHSKNIESGILYACSTQDSNKHIHILFSFFLT